ncbi:hypothetical protein X797_008752 [Metarhizium robertsii]|uniref:Uncharacterized protein n=2 Tax=Metarhizium robertsii TaxID=568076 RepID=E9F6W3_METRA
MPQKKLTSVIDIVDKLVDVSIAIKNRGKLKDPEEARVGDAFALLAAGRPPPGCPGEANKSRYLEFLLRVKQFMGPAGVVISAAGLGVSAVAGMRDRLRVDLPVKMKEREREFAKTELETIACIFSAKTRWLQVPHNVENLPPCLALRQFVVLKLLQLQPHNLLEMLMNLDGKMSGRS